MALEVKKPHFNAGDASSIPGSGRSPGGRYGNLLQHSCLENSMDRGAWWAVVHGVTKESDTTEQLNNNTGFSVSTCNEDLFANLTPHILHFSQEMC